MFRKEAKRFVKHFKENKLNINMILDDVINIWSFDKIHRIYKTYVRKGLLLKIT